ncbi:metalloprotease TIKI1-like isoform X2 [Latimeria chalumnae]|uniref:metalloprotease TIKI1-like isoform X2 n=1 Tax=Latimeria chalumnae TaxID=7897 RepID=UPI00313E04CD
MGKRVKALLEEHPDKSFFFAFGAGHFLGNNTVIDVLRREGYEVEHTPAGYPVNSEKSRKSSSSSSTSSVYTSYSTSQELNPSSLPNEEEELMPHLLLPDSIDLLEKADRKHSKKKRKKQQKKQRLRQFNDLWVRIEESTTVPPPRIRIINGYITVEPLPRGHGRSSHIQAPSDLASGTSLSPFTLILTLAVLALTFVL